MDTHGWGSRILVGAALAALPMLGACNGDETAERNQLPVFVSGPVRTTAYDGASDDLLTAGLGKTGLASAAAPAFADPSRPTAAELRRVAIWSNYRALVDMSANGGYGRFWGPNVDLDGNDTLGEGRIAGTEYLAYADDGSGRKNVTLLVQVPASFDPAQPCIV
ncbi:D-(-)-3-hydroxybutyrate oligomer hydrolase, partial [Burkholderia ubonensis]